ncbi:MAG: transketolase [Phycisphaerales bacterium]|nr:transketolase [Phycisphaerales bacterium]
MTFEAAVHSKAIRIDSLALKMCAEAGSGHPTTATSLGQIVTVLMYHTMRWVPEDPGYPTSDRLVLSEGHAVPIVYGAFIDLGAAVGLDDHLRPANMDDIGGFRSTSSPLDGHPNPQEGFLFFDAATGSLGQGLSAAAGLAQAARLDDLDQRIYCIIGDGESREGQVTEALDYIVDHQLDNVLPIFNCNEYGQAGSVSNQQSPEKIAARLTAAGYHVETIDGHDPLQIKAAFDRFTEGGQGPMAVVARTIKGWGMPSMQGDGWHGKPAAGEALDVALEELNASGASLIGSQEGGDLMIYPPAIESRPAGSLRPVSSFPDALRSFELDAVLASGRFATRKAYGVALRELGHANTDVVVLDADVCNSTFAQWFRDDHELASRFSECKIAEQNMISAGLGFAAAGKIPFCSTFAKFLTRAYDQIEMAMNSGANIKLVGSHSGISLAADGPSQMSLPDVAWFRSLGSIKNHKGSPGCWTLQPADAYAAYGLTMAMAEHDGMCYMRTHRPDVEFLYDEQTTFRLGGMEVLTQGRDLLIASAGFMLHECNKSLDALDKMGIDASLVDLYSLPFDEDEFLDLANENGGMVLVVEDNYGGGLFSAVAEACARSGDAFTVEQLCVTRIPKSAKSEREILEQCGLHHEAITSSAARILGLVNA